MNGYNTTPRGDRPRDCHRHRWPGRLAGMSLLFGLLACSGQSDVASDSNLPAPSAKAQANTPAGIPGPATPTPELLTGQWQEGDEQIQWRAEQTNGVVMRILETAVFGTDGRLSRELRYMRDGALQHFSETRTQTMQSPDRTPAPMEVLLILELAGDSVVHGEKRVDGRVVPMRSFEIDYAKRHAAQILAATRRSP